MLQTIVIVAILYNVYVVCGACTSGQFQCNDLQCIDNIFVCDGAFDCSDFSDELETSCSEVSIEANCPEGTHRCYSTGSCVITACVTEESTGIGIDIWALVLLTVLGAVVLALAVLFLIYFFRCRRNRVQQKNIDDGTDETKVKVPFPASSRHTTQNETAMEMNELKDVKLNKVQPEREEDNDDDTEVKIPVESLFSSPMPTVFERKELSDAKL